MGDSEDWNLLRQWQQGDEAAGEQLLTRYLGLLTRFFHNKVSNADTAADLISDTMLACTTGKDRIDQTGAFRSYLFAVAMNQLRVHYRKQVKRKRELDDFADVCVGESRHYGSLTSLMSKKREAQLLVRGLRRIPLDQQIVLELNILEGLNGPEIAELLGVPAPTVYTRLRRGKERLKAECTAIADDPADAQSTVMGLQTWAVMVRKQISD